MIWAVAFYMTLNTLALALFGWDKLAARLDRRRITERTLHVLAVAGGGAGSVVGQQLFRHKTRRPRFAAITWASISAHVGVWMVWWWLRM